MMILKIDWCQNLKKKKKRKIAMSGVMKPNLNVPDSQSVSPQSSIDNKYQRNTNG